MGNPISKIVGFFTPEEQSKQARSNRNSNMGRIHQSHNNRMSSYERHASNIQRTENYMPSHTVQRRPIIPSNKVQRKAQPLNPSQIQKNYENNSSLYNSSRDLKQNFEPSRNMGTFGRQDRDILREARPLANQRDTTQRFESQSHSTNEGNRINRQPSLSNNARRAELRSYNIMPARRIIDQPMPDNLMAQMMQQDDDAKKVQKQLEDMILKFNCLTSQKRPHQKLKTSNSYKDLQKYQQVFQQLVKKQILADIKQRLQKKSFVATFKGRFVQNRHESEFQLDHTNSKKKTKLDILLLKGKRLAIASQKEVLTEKQLLRRDPANIELCFVNNDRKGNYKVKFLDNQSEKIGQYKYLIDIDSIISSTREYYAIENLSSFSMYTYITDPKLIRNQESQIKKGFINRCQIMQTIKEERNKSQVETIKYIASCKNGIHLVQGPPGTGKTSTILSLVGLESEIIKKKIDIKGDKKIIMMCSQSNAAIDDVCRRIKDRGVMGQTKYKMVRIGTVSMANQDLIEFNLTHICEKKLLRQKTSVQYEIEKQIQELKIKQNKSDNPNQIYRKIDQINEQILRIAHEKDQKKKQFQELIKEQLSETHILLSTLNSSGRKIIQQYVSQRVSILLIDEACQATQPSLLIPLQLNPQKVVLIGDPMQLPPTVLSEKQGGSSLCCSYFERCLKNGRKYHLLDTQYRMNPTLSEFPNLMFYGNKLKNGPTKRSPKSLTNFIEKENTLSFFDVSYGKEEKNQNKSFINIEESILVVETIDQFLRKDMSLTIGVITPYKAQANEIELLLIKKLMKQKLPQVKVSTVDAFQGQQRNIIILSTVRANRQGQVGFTDNQNRLNVSLTRAQNLLIIFGNANTLVQNRLLGDLVDFIRNKGEVHHIQNERQSCGILRRHLWGNLL